MAKVLTQQVNEAMRQEADLPSVLMKEFGNVFKTIAIDFENSSFLHGMGIETEISKQIAATFSDPVGMAWNAFRQTEQSLQSIIMTNLILPEFKKYSSIIRNLFLTSPGVLHFVVDLNEYTMDNEREIMNVVMAYEEHPISQRFPLLITFAYPEVPFDTSGFVQIGF